MPPAIRVENLSKRYTLGLTHAGSIRELASRFTDRLFRRTSPSSSLPAPRSPLPASSFWALRDVSFEVQPGEVLGIIGRNGAGKSTLLKILSRITAPTSGRIEINGRVASLLEVGTGFHPELTGRENVYLNGAILGMSRAEITRKFDEIVTFAEIAKFIDTPVKRYSSGMYVRLAFAVAAHLEQEILIVDEVLAVGDSLFQKKCLGKIGEISSKGRTVLVVSHNMAVVSNLCSKALLLNRGQCDLAGTAADIITRYVESGRKASGERIWVRLEDAPGNDRVRLRAVRIASCGETTGEVSISSDVHVELEFWNLREGALVSSSIHLLDNMGVVVFASANFPSANLSRDSWFGRPHSRGRYRTRCTIPANFLNEGRYAISVFLLTDVTNIQVAESEVLAFTVNDTGEMRREYQGAWAGVVRPKLAWTTECIDDSGVLSLGERK